MLTRPILEQAARACGLSPLSAVLTPLDGSPEPVQIDPKRSFYPASMLKVPLAAAALSLVQAGELSLRERVEVTPQNMTANDAESPLVPGYRGELAVIIERAITHSDNVATNLLFDICGRERATGIARNAFGLQSTAFHRKLSGAEPLIADPGWDGRHRNQHSCGDCARLLTMIARHGIPHARLLLKFLGRQHFNDKLSEGLQHGDVFAHKTGDTEEVTHDGGILTTAQGRRYVLVVYTGLRSTKENNARFAPFMRAIRGYL
ncbi:MAG: hypothetical protein DLM50_05125 [Candidatus Meridianibacter frigidus]|nr:MAG: hypothetical protein DLM50_05125 [Candidatus Eremiobacteraeota bacterium]